MVFGRLHATVELKSVAAKYRPKADVKDALMQDFHSVRQALNVASADQRVLVVLSGKQEQLKPLRESLRRVASDERIIGRFHFDFETDDAWKKTVSGLKKEPGIFVIRPGEFGLKGTVMSQLPLNSGNAEIVTTLLAANSEFAKTTKKKVYRSHVSKGTQLGVYFEGGVEYGEDRDADGKIDFRGGPPRRTQSCRQRR